MTDVVVKITGTSELHQEGQEVHKDVIEFITEGTMVNRGKVVKITYNELEDSGLMGGVTSVTIGPRRVRVAREGDNALPLSMEFEKGRRFNGIYATPYGEVGLELLTNSIEGFGHGGKDEQSISIDYSLSLKGLSESNNKFELEVLREQEN